MTGVAVPRTSGIVKGQPVAFRMGADDLDEAVLAQDLGVAVAIGSAAGMLSLNSYPC